MRDGLSEVNRLRMIDQKKKKILVTVAQARDRIKRTCNVHLDGGYPIGTHETVTFLSEWKDNRCQ